MANSVAALFVGLELEYRLKNVSRAEPPAAVFELPAGYTKQDRQPTAH